MGRKNTVYAWHCNYHSQPLIRPLQDKSLSHMIPKFRSLAYLDHVFPACLSISSLQQVLSFSVFFSIMWCPLSEYLCLSIIIHLCYVACPVPFKFLYCLYRVSEFGLLMYPVYCFMVFPGEAKYDSLMIPLGCS